ncbi:MAG: DUF2800 domain-containing protein [Methylibium sp.]|nr:DUF2800 domain-containing protein [Methylibium sp.]
MSAHALYSPSRLPNLECCAGWLSDPTPGPAAVRGSRVDAVLTRLVNEAAFGPIEAEDADALAFGVEVLDTLRARFPTHHWQGQVALDSGLPDVYGTADLIGHDDWSETVVVLDWKTGRGDRPDAGSNLQTGAYAIGAARKYPAAAVVLTMIAELDKNTLTECRLTREDLVCYASDIAAVCAAAEQATPADYRPSDSACRYCARKLACPAVRVAVVDTTSTAPVADVAALPADQVASLLAEYAPKADLVLSWIEALRKRAVSLIDDGQMVPGYAVRERVSRYEWQDEAQAIAALQAWSQERSATPDLLALVSPAQAIAAIAALKLAPKKELDGIVRSLCQPRMSRSLVESKQSPPKGPEVA